MRSPRFLLTITSESNLLRAALITRELEIVASARQTFQLVPLNDGTRQFDPAQVWYLMKKVIAACLDIGRTQSREIAGVAVVGEINARVIWSQQGDEVMSKGSIEPGNSPAGRDSSNTTKQSDASYSGTMATWLLWNLTGGEANAASLVFGDTLARAPFDAKLPILTVMNIASRDMTPSMGQGTADYEWILKAAEQAWSKLTGPML